MSQYLSEGRLLILDDDAAIGRMIQMIAETLGMSAQYTADPADFFEQLATFKPTHVALDLVMPEMDGVEVLIGLAKAGCRARIIITSGVGARVLDAAGRSAAEHGLDIAGVLPKPFTLADLRYLLQEPAPASGSRATDDPAEILPMVTAAELGPAFADKQLYIVYQPKIECSTGALAGFEALVRWQHPNYGLIMPDRFVPFAEDCGLIDELTDEVLMQSLEWFASHFGAEKCASAGHGEPDSDITLSMNLSARNLKDQAFIDRILEHCHYNNIGPERLIFELTETSAMEDPVISLDLLTRMRMKGFRLSLDDFGTGFSSMLQLVRLPFSELKVDKSFVMTSTDSRESRTVIKSVVDLGRSLGLRVVAEGVESAAHLKYLNEIGCDYAQGYHIARPMAGKAILDWLSLTKPTFKPSP